MSKIPDFYFIDPDTDLALNTPNQWSQSPYLGAVRFNDETYISQICIPQAVWEKLIHQNHQKWKDVLPQSILHTNTGNIRGFSTKDPRQAAWFMQAVLYSGDNDTEELIEDYLEMKYLGGLGDLWNDLIAQIPEFEGEALTSENELEFFKKFDAETRKKISTQRKNAIDYDKTMRRKINAELQARKLNIDIDYYGIEFFVTCRGSVKLKDFKTLTFGDI